MPLFCEGECVRKRNNSGVNSRRPNHVISAQGTAHEAAVRESSIRRKQPKGFSDHGHPATRLGHVARHFMHLSALRASQPLKGATKKENNLLFCLLNDWSGQTFEFS